MKIRPLEIPTSATKWYRRWISMFPESWDERDLERFYMFISVLLSNSKIERSRSWLKEKLKADCKKLTDNDIDKYCDIYEHIKNYKNVWKSQQAKLIAQDEFKNRMVKARKKYSE